ncbi:MAG: ABC-2 family transporter protein [Bacilli bacterium]|nr:ABC-2 family transporter protein [Bacilli bacterium]
MVKVYLKYLKLHLKSVMQYKLSFILGFISQFFVFFASYFVIISLFEKFGSIKGFTVYEILFTFAVVNIGFSLNEVFARGVDNFDHFIKAGKYDQLLLKPVNIFLQVLGSDINFLKLSKLLQSIVILIIALVNLDIDWSVFKVLIILNMIAGAFCVFLGVFILNAAYCFYTVEGLEVRNVLSYGGREMAQYPVSVFKKEFATFFTYVIPFAFINYYPLLYFTGRESNILLVFSPLIIILFVIPCYYIFNISSRKYLSTGS